MKPYQLSALRRKVINKLPTIAVYIWIIAIMVWILALSAMYKKHLQTIKHVEPTHTVVATPTPKPLTDEEYIYSLPYGKIIDNLVWKIYGQESTWGKFDGCNGNGYNGFGYGWDGSHYPCYDSVKEVGAMVGNWLNDKLQTMTVPQALCYYNTGNPNLYDCGYAERVLAL